MTRRESTLMRTVTSLYGLQIAGYILPLVTFPYLLRVLGPEGFGVYAFAVFVARFGLMITDYGFAYTAVRAISRRRRNDDRTDDIASAVLWARVILFGLCALGILLLTLFVERFQRNSGVFWVTLLGVGGFALLPTWLYQAYERLPVVAMTSLAARVLTTVLTFVLVRDASDITTAAGLWSAPWLIAAIATLLLAPRMLGVRFGATSAADVRHQFADGGAVFVSLFGASLYTVANGIILGLFASDAVVGYYAAAEGIVIAAAGVITPLSQAVYTRSVHAVDRGREATVTNIRRLLAIFGTLGLGISAVLVAFAPTIATIVAGETYGQTADLLRVLGLIPLFIAVATVLSVHALLPLGHDRSFSFIVVGIGVLSVLTSLVVVPHFLAHATTIVAVSAEALVCVMCALVLWRRGLSPRASGTRPPDRPVPID